MALFDLAHPSVLIRETQEGICEKTDKKMIIKKMIQEPDTTHKMLSEILNEQTGISPEMVVKLLEKLLEAFGNATQFWANLEKITKSGMMKRR